jgi:hypothetical protein
MSATGVGAESPDAGNDDRIPDANQIRKGISPQLGRNADQNARIAAADALGRAGLGR